MSFKEIYLQVNRNKEVLINQGRVLQENDLEIKKRSNQIQRLETKFEELNNKIAEGERRFAEYKKYIKEYKKYIKEYEKQEIIFDEARKENRKIKREYEQRKIKNKILKNEEIELKEQLSILKNKVITKNERLDYLNKLVSELDLKVKNEEIIDNILENVDDWENPELYDNIQIYESNKELNTFIFNFVDKYFPECSNLIIPEVESKIINYIDTGKASLYGINSFFFEINKTITFYDELLVKFIHLLEKKGFNVASRKILIIKYIKFEVIKQIYNNTIVEINVSKIKKSNAKEAFYSLFDYYPEKELQQYGVIAFISYYFFKNKIPTFKYDNLDSFYEIQKKYYEEYELNKLDRVISSGKNEASQKVMINEIISGLDLMNGFEFEKFLSKLFIKLGFKSQKTKSTGDQGADIIVENEGVIYAVQAKRYSTKVGNKAIQEAISGKAYYGTDCAMVVSTNYFTKQAVDLASKSNVILWNRDKLISMVNEAYQE